MIYLVTYDLYDVSDVTRESVEDYLRTFTSCKILTTTWVIETTLNKSTIRDKISSIAERSGSANVFIVDIESNNFDFLLYQVKINCLKSNFGIS